MALVYTCMFAPSSHIKTDPIHEASYTFARTKQSIGKQESCNQLRKQWVKVATLAAASRPEHPETTMEVPVTFSVTPVEATTVSMTAFSLAAVPTLHKQLQPLGSKQLRSHLSIRDFHKWHAPLDKGSGTSDNRQCRHPLWALALKDIWHYQKSIGFLINQMPFQLLVWDLNLQPEYSSYKLQSSALNALWEAAEVYLVGQPLHRLC